MLTVTDIDPSKKPDQFQFDPLPGRFADISSEIDDDYLDAIVTTMFIETAQNPLTYVDIIFRLLKPGGIWINYGSMNYVHGEDSLSMPLNMLKNILKKEYKFKFVKDEIVQSTYAAGCDQNTDVQIGCTFFTCQKEY